MIERTEGNASIVWTGAEEGHLGHQPPRGDHDETCCGSEARARRKLIKAGDWAHLTQVHGDDVVHVTASTAPGAVADAAVTDDPAVTLAIATADCASIAFASDAGVIGAAHGGWQGLSKGVVARTVEKMRRLGAREITAALGPCIHVECYEFGADRLDELVGRYGPSVRGETADGSPALNLPELVDRAVEMAGASLSYVDEHCTACSGQYFSYRTTKTDSRQVMLVSKT